MKLPKDILIRFTKIPISAEEAEKERAISLLSGDEYLEYLRMSNERRRLHFLFGRMLLRNTVNEVLGHASAQDDWSIHIGSFGKPEIVSTRGLARLHFSISHADRFVFVAVSRIYELGLDIEKVPRHHIDIDAALSPEEVSHIEALKPRERLKSIITMWTLKEALAKMLGVGVLLDFQNITVLQEARRIVVRDGSKFDMPGKVHLLTKCIELENQPYIVSLCFSKTNRQDKGHWAHKCDRDPEQRNSLTEREFFPL